MKPIAVLSALILTSTCWAAGNANREAYFRCKDAQGQTRFGDSLPPECMGQDTEVLSASGNVLRVIDGEASQAAKAARKNADEAALKAKNDAAMRDRMLVEAYLSVQEIEALRDQRMGLLESQMRVDQQTLDALHDREIRLLQQVRRYKPYNDKPSAAALPDHVAEDMVNLVKSRETTSEHIASKQAERKELEDKFASDIKRFKELKGLK